MDSKLHRPMPSQLRKQGQLYTHLLPKHKGDYFECMESEYASLVFSIGQKEEKFIPTGEMKSPQELIMHRHIFVCPLAKQKMHSSYPPNE